MAQIEGVRMRPAGWYADPLTVGAARYWDGHGWTDLVAWGGVTRHDPTPLDDVVRSSALARATTVSEYLADAARRHVVAPTVAEVLRLDVERGVPGADTTAATRTTSPRPASIPAAARVAATAPARPPWPSPAFDAAPQQLRSPETPSAPARPLAAPRVAEQVEALPREPGRAARWWEEARVAFRSDIALHGLAYLGVILLFAGVTGLITFSFGDVAPWVRASTELTVPSALFLSAWYLYRRNAVFVAAALTFLGGAILPIIVAASVTDGAPFPPDFGGRPLPIAQGVAVALVAVALAVVVGRSPSSPLRYIVGPACWMAAGLMAGVWRDPVPVGYDTARPDSLQLSVILAALTATVFVCPWSRVPRSLSTATRLVALPIAGVVYVLELVLAADEDWPLASTIVVGLGALLLLEFLSERVPPLVVAGAHYVIVAVTAARVATRTDPVWVAMCTAIALLVLVEYVGRRRPTKVGIMAGLALVGWALLVTLDDPWPAAVGFAVLTVWGVWRHAMPADWLPASDEFGVVPAIAAAVTTAALWDLSPRGPALVVTAAVVLLLAIGGRLSRTIADDRLWRWFVPVAAVAVALVSATLPWGDLPIEAAIASAVLAGAVLLSATPIGLRTWTTSAMLAWSLANIGEALDIGRDAQAITLAVLALMLLIGSLIVARPVCTHTATIGHISGLAALVAPTWPGWAATSVVAAAMVGWWATTFVDERGAAVHLDALRHAIALEPEAGPSSGSELVDELAPLASLVGLWATVFLAADAAGWVARDDPWAAVVSGAVMLVAAAAIRVVPWRRATRLVLAWATLIGAATASSVTIAATGPERDHWSPVASLVVGLAVVGVTRAPRPLMFTWIAWIGGATLAVFVADRLGLDRDWTDVALSGWGAAALLGGLAVRRIRRGPLPTGTFVRDRLLLPPTFLGAVAFVVGGGLGLSEGTDIGIGWTAAGMSVVVLAAALLMPLGVLAAPAQVLATTAYALLAPWEPLDRPWTFLPWAMLLLGAALATRRSDGWSAARWDLPSFAVAHGVAVLALIAAVDSDTIVATYAGFGALAVAVAVVVRRLHWAVAGAALLLVAGVDAGHGWIALVLFTEGLALTVAGLLVRARAARWALLSIGAGAIIGAWFDLVVWQSWAVSTVFYATVPAGAVIALTAAIGLRTGRVPTQLAAVWTIAGSLLALGTAAVGLDEVARRPGGLLLAGSLLVLAIAAGVTAAVGGAGMRWIAAGLAVAAWVPAAWGLEASDTMATLGGTGVALVGLATAVWVNGRWPDALWLHPGAFYAAATQLGAVVAAVHALPDRDLVIGVMLAVAAELVAFGVLSRRPELYVLAPIPACGAWLLYATDALAGEANWFTVPIGLTLLVMVGLVRWIRRGRGGDPAAYDMIALEVVGMTFLVASALARTLAGHLWNGVLAIGIGVLLAGWGTMTRVRWRAAFGAGSVVLAIVLLIGVPLSRSVTWRGPTLWLTLTAIGVAAIVVASALERGRDRLGRVVQRIDRLTADWERIPRRPDRDDDNRHNQSNEKNSPQPTNNIDRRRSSATSSITSRSSSEGLAARSHDA